MIKKLFGNRIFYKNLIAVTIPIILAQLITQFVSLLDNLMVGQLTTAEFNGVSIANQFFFIFNLAIFGAFAGPGIYATQHHGAKNLERVKECIRYKWVIGIIISIIGIIVFLTFDDLLFNLFIHEEELGDVDPLEVIKSGKEYVKVMLIGLIPFMISEIYSTNLREAKQTLIPMVANIIAVFVNLILNYIFIFGKFGAPALGVVGAAIGTVVARIICCLIVMIYAHSSKKYRFNSEVFQKLLPSKESFITIFKKSYILLINEFLWSLGMMLINYCYSFRGLEVVAAVNISSMFVNLFALIGTSYGNGISVLLGQQLGARDFEEAKISSYRYLTFSVILGFVVAFIMYCLRATVPTLYEMSDKIIFMSEDLIAITALLLPIRVYSTACYFTIRSGGKLFITFLFDSVFTLCIRVLITYIVVKTTNLSIYYVYFISEILEVIKIVIGTILVKKGIWIQSVSN